MGIIKLTGMQRYVNQANFHERLLYLQYLHYRTKNLLQLNLQNGSSIIFRNQKRLENFTYEKTRFTFRK